MSEWAIVAANVVSTSIFVGGITAWVYLDQRGKTRRREVEHAERMRAIELGRPPADEAGLARSRAAAAIGIAVPVTALSLAVAGTFAVGVVKDTGWLVTLIALVWAVCGGVSALALRIAHRRLWSGEPQPPSGERPGSSRPEVSSEEPWPG